MAITQIRHDTPGHAYYQRKRAAGKSHREALRCLKRQLSDAVYPRTRRHQDLLGTGGVDQTVPRGHTDSAIPGREWRSRCALWLGWLEDVEVVVAEDVVDVDQAVLADVALVDL